MLKTLHNLIDRALNLSEDIEGWRWNLVFVPALICAIPLWLYAMLVGAIAYLCDAVAFVWDRLFWSRDDGY